MKHEPSKPIYDGRSNRKHAHNTKRGVRYKNHWFDVYRCPVCGRTFRAKDKNKKCTGREDAK